MTAGSAGAVPLDHMLTVSKGISDEVEAYMHCPYQAAIAGIIIS